MRYFFAILACFALFIVYTMVGLMMGWRHGGGIIPMLIFFAACSFIWKKITKKDNTENINSEDNKTK